MLDLVGNLKDMFSLDTSHVRYSQYLFFFLLQHLSTSPEQEPKHFEASVRAALVQIRDYPEPLKSVFKGQPHQFKKEPDGKWTKID